MVSHVRNRLMLIHGYTPYCGNCKTMFRTVFYKRQFHCAVCNWHSDYDEVFIATWQAKHNIIDPSTGAYTIRGIDPFRTDLDTEEQLMIVDVLRENPKEFYKMLGLITILNKLSEGDK